MLLVYKHIKKEDKNMLRRFFKDESGQGMVEYALIIALIAVVVIGAVVILGGRIKDIFSSAGDELTTSAGA